MRSFLTSLRQKTKALVALLLTFTAGIVDIVGYISVYHYFVAHMTGTTVHLGNELVQSEWADVAKSGIVIVSFVAGSVVGRTIIESGARAGRRTVASITLLAEAFLVLSFMFIHHLAGTEAPSQELPFSTICVLLGILAAAMGLQTATLTRIGPLTIHTTFVTGMLNKFAQSVSQWMFWLHDHWGVRGSISAAIHPVAFRNALFMAAIWISYLLGSITGTIMNSNWSVAALYLPVLILVATAGIDQIQPLSLEEESEQLSARPSSMKQIFARSDKLHAGFLLVLLLSCASSGAYSVLTHEELIDLAWNESIRPLLLAKFPRATDHQLVVAHSYAYGGSVIQDMGYYPFGKQFLSNLTHYVRSGDFVLWMLQNARTLDEYAFAIGALSHYLGDSVGHSEAINPSTAIAFPKLERKYGKSVTYGESPHGHIRTEFAFDVQELSSLEFAPPAYLRAVGFRVPRKFLERAFVHTYGFDIHSRVGPDQPALRSYRSAVRSFIPAFAEAEVVLHRHQFPKPQDDEAYQLFAERVARTNYDRRWKHTYKGPGFKAHLLAIVVFIVPKIGGAADLAIKIPTPETQHLYFHSVNQAVNALNETLHRLQENGSDPIPLANLDLDTGRHEKPGDYALADETYARLVEQIAAKPETTISRTLKQHILEYYSGTSQEHEPILERLALIEKMKTREDR